MSDLQIIIILLFLAALLLVIASLIAKYCARSQSTKIYSAALMGRAETSKSINSRQPSGAMDGAEDEIIKTNFQKSPVMTPSEQKLFRILIEAFPKHFVFPQVSFGALLRVGKGQRNEAWFRSSVFRQKRADYVICDRIDFKVSAIVELDDRTHNQEKDKKRDALLLAAGYKVQRIHVTEKLTLDDLRMRVGIDSVAENVGE